jgi:DNA repair protein RecN (Recombination protein N)
VILELRIENLALIERASIRLGPGFNALTGETGAGKSIIVGALSLLLGERASASTVRPGAERATVEGVFDVTGQREVLALLEEQGIGAEDGLLILRREVAAEGRNRAWVNGSASTAAVVGALGGLLVDLHGQHDHQSLLRSSEQRAILDAFGGAQPLVTRVREAYERRGALAASLDELDAARERRDARAAELQACIDDIDEAAPVEGEDTALEAEARRLENAEELAALATGVHDALYAADDALLARLDEQRRALARLQVFDPEREEDARALDDAYYAIEELARRVGDYASRVEHDPGRLEEIRVRKDLLYRLRRRYEAESSDALAALAAEARSELESLAGMGARRDRLAADLARAQDAFAEAAGALTEARGEAAAALERALASILPSLGLAGGFQVRLDPRDAIGAQGAERVSFLFAPNAGFDALPLSRIASGGELSRVMLALKTVLAEVDRVPSLAFDEVDAGVGGEVAVRIAHALQEVADRHQVLVVTHLPQIAARAEHHVRVEKDVREGTTLTRVEPLEGDARVRELARMLGSAEGRESLRHAEALLAGDSASPESTGPATEGKRELASPP